MDIVSISTVARHTWRGVNQIRLNCKPLCSVFCRLYAIQYFHETTEKPTYSYLASSYIRSKYKFPDYTGPTGKITNVYNEKHAIHQLDSVLSLSHDPTADDIFSLFRLYCTCDLPTLLQHLTSATTLIEGRRKIKKITDTFNCMTFLELDEMSHYLKTLKACKLNYFHKIGHELAQECINRSNEADIGTIVRTFFTVNNLDVYGAKGKLLVQLCEHSHEAGPEHAWQILYILTSFKSKPNVFAVAQEMFQVIEPFLKQISFEEAGITANAMFRFLSNVKLPSGFIDSLVDHLLQRIENKNLESETLDAHAIVSIVKLLRVCNYQDPVLLSKLSTFIKSQATVSITIEFMAHIIALYANCRLYDKSVFNIAEQVFFSNLASAEKKVRIKDVSRMLWSLSQVGHSCSKPTLDCAVKELNNFKLPGELRSRGHHYVDSILALLILEADVPEHMVERTFQPYVVESMKAWETTRRLSRLANIHRACGVLYPTMHRPTVEAFQTLPLRSLDDELVHRPLFPIIDRAIQFINSKSGSVVLKFEFLVPTIGSSSIVPVGTVDKVRLKNILGSEDVDDVFPDMNDTVADVDSKLGVSNELSTTRKVLIEVNDVNTTLVDGTSLIGLEYLKRKILQLEGWSICVIDENHIQECHDDDALLGALLLEKIFGK